MRRINRPEMMDQASDPAELAGDLDNLERINRFLGGHSLVRRQLDRLLYEFRRSGHATSEECPCRSGRDHSRVTQSRVFVALDVGTGGGDLPREVITRLRARRIPTLFLLVDRNPLTLACARARSSAFPEMRFALGDARRLPLGAGSADVVLCSLLLHHFSEEDAVLILREMARVTRRFVIVNDLRRSPTALVLIWLITRCCRNRMTRYDGPLSVRRAFTTAELRHLARAAGLTGARVMAQPFYRQALVYEKRAR